MSATLIPFPGRTSPDNAKPVDQLVARLTCAAYEAALRAGLTGPFIEAQLSIWSQIRRVVESDPVLALDAATADRAQEGPRRIVFVRAGAR